MTEQDSFFRRKIDGHVVVACWEVEFDCWVLYIEIPDNGLPESTDLALRYADFDRYHNTIVPEIPEHGYGLYFRRPGDFNVFNDRVGIDMRDQAAEGVAHFECNVDSVFVFAESLLLSN